jgi:hypothetical protein
VILPSRGLVFSRTIAEVLREVRGLGCEWELFMAHSRPIPECFNEPIAEGMAWGATHFWLVEEDMALPAGILGELAARGAPIVSADYPVKPGVLCVNRDDEGRVRHTGTGCLLVTREALEASGPFTTDWWYVITDNGRTWTRRRVPESARSLTYGMHDIDFGMQWYRRGRPIEVIPTRAGQRRVSRPAAARRNAEGWHDIEEMWS